MLFAYPSPVFVPGCSLGRSSYLLGSNGLLAGLVELFNGLLIVTQILLATNEDDGETAAEMKNFGDPLCLRHVSAVSYLEIGKRIGGNSTFSWTLSRESGESTAKQIKMTCESGYERGRRRS